MESSVSPTDAEKLPGVPEAHPANVRDLILSVHGQMLQVLHPGPKDAKLVGPGSFRPLAKAVCAGYSSFGKENFMNGSLVNFRDVKERVSLEQVVFRYGARLRRVSNSLLRGRCPLPTHASEHSLHSFNIDTAKNVWACHSASCVAARGGHIGGDVLDFVAVMEDCSLGEAAKALTLLAGEPSGESLRHRTVRVQSQPGAGYGGTANKPLSFTLSRLDPTHPYLLARGITSETVQYFGVGFFPGRGSMSGRVVIPIHDEVGRLVAYAGRSVDGSEPKYRLPRGFAKSAVLFNLHRLRSKEVIVVEGFFDCMNVSQAGYRNVVALMGSTLSQAHERLITRFETIILFLDGDEAGRRATKVIADRLKTSHSVRIANLHVGQPDQFAPSRIHDVLGPFRHPLAP